MPESMRTKSVIRWRKPKIEMLPQNAKRIKNKSAKDGEHRRIDLGVWKGQGIFPQRKICLPQADQRNSQNYLRINSVVRKREHIQDAQTTKEKGETCVMTEPNWEKCTEEELWEYVASELSANNIDSVLVGGSVVSVYTKGAYRSGDLDMILEGYTVKYADIDRILNKIGFYRNGSKNFYQHPQCKHIFIEFLPPPLSIGEDYSITPSHRTVEDRKIKILSPTDCIRDRLASYIYFKARECLDQAILVAKSQPHDLELIRKWCENEKALAAYQEFRDRI
jgi:hypothetical protein